MAIPTRTVVTSQFRPDGAAREGEVVRYSLRRDSYTADGTIPTGDVFATVGTDGVAEASLWPNAEGLTPSHYTYWLPDGNSGDFVLPEGTTPISLEEIRLAQGTLTWNLPTIEDFLEMFRAILAGPTGSIYIGWIQIGLGAIARSVRDKLRDDISILDFIPVAEHDAIRDRTSTYDIGPDLIAAATAVSDAGGGTVRFPFGRYTLLTQAALTIDNVTLHGEGGATIYVPDNSVGRPFVLLGCTSVIVEGLTFFSTRTASSTNAVCVENSSYVTVRKCRFENFLGFGTVVSEATTAAVHGTSFTFDAATHTITNLDGGMDVVQIGDSFRIGRSRQNNVLRVAAAVTATTVTVDTTLIDEDASGLDVGLFLATACDHFEAEGNIYINCGVAGINHFPKVKSAGVKIHHNVFRGCAIINGVPVTASAAVKGGQMTTSSSMHHNDIAECGTGFALGTHYDLDVSYNRIRDTERFGIALSITYHRTFTGSSERHTMDHVSITNNEIWMTPEFALTASGSYAALNINGLATDAGPVDFLDNRVRNWRGNPWSISKSLARVRGITIRGLDAYNCGGFGTVSVVEGQATTTNGSATLTAVNDGLGGAPIGWYPTSGLLGTGIPADTDLVSITQLSGTIDISLPAIVAGTFSFLAGPDGDIEFLGTTTLGGTTITGITSTSALEVGMVLSSEALIEGTLIEDVTAGSTSFLMSRQATASNTVAITTEYPVGLTLERNTYTNVITRTTATTTNGSLILTNIPLAVWKDLKVGHYAIAVGIQTSSTIAALPTEGSATLTLAATASATVSVMFAPLRRANIRSHGGAITEDRYIGGGDYALVLSGSFAVRRTYFEDFNPVGTANRGPIFLSDTGAYAVMSCEADGNVAYLINNTATSALIEHNNRVPATARATITTTGTGTFATAASGTSNGRRLMRADAAPTAPYGTFNIGDAVLTTAPTPSGPLMHVTTTAGIPGTATTLGLHYALKGTATWNPASIANDAMASTTVTVTGAVVGQPVFVGYSSITAAGWALSGSVTAADTVTVTLVNKTGGAVDLPSGTVTVYVQQN